MAVYNLSRALDRERYTRRANALYSKGAVVEMVERAAVRSLPQNKYLHLLLQYFAVQQGEQTVQYVKDVYYKRLCNSDLFVREHYDRLLARTVATLRSSSTLTVAEMSLSIDRFKTWAAQQGIYLPDAARPAEIAQAQDEVDCCLPFLCPANND